MSAVVYAYRSDLNNEHSTCERLSSQPALSVESSPQLQEVMTVCGTILHVREQLLGNLPRVHS